MSRVGTRTPVQVNVVCFTVRSAEKSPEVLILKRNSKKGGFWQCVTGGVEVGETTSQAALREVGEELGITVEPDRLLTTTLDYSFTAQNGTVLREYVFGYRISDPSAVTLSDEHVALKWCTPEEAKQCMKYDNNRKAIDAVMSSLSKNVGNTFRSDI